MKSIVDVNSWQCGQRSKKVVAEIEYMKNILDGNVLVWLQQFKKYMTNILDVSIFGCEEVLMPVAVLVHCYMEW